MTKRNSERQPEPSTVRVLGYPSQVEYLERWQREHGDPLRAAVAGQDFHDAYHTHGMRDANGCLLCFDYFEQFGEPENPNADGCQDCGLRSAGHIAHLTDCPATAHIADDTLCPDCNHWWSDHAGPDCVDCDCPSRRPIS